MKENPGWRAYRQFKLLKHTPQVIYVVHNVLIHNILNNVYQDVEFYSAEVKLAYHIGVSTASQQTWYCRIHIAVDC